MRQFSGPTPDRFNVQFAKGLIFNVTDRLFPTALREMRADFSKRPVIISLLALGLILGISGPFNTLALLPAVPRVFYWIVVVGLTFAAGGIVSTIIHTVLDRRLGWLSYMVSTLAIGMIVNIVLGVINLVTFGVWFGTLFVFLSQLGIVTLISGVVEFSNLALRFGVPDEPVMGVPLVDRLPFEKRGEIVALSAEDHYVRIATTNGTELVLMRLSDAANEVGDTVGLQVHRSHWVAVNQVREVKRIGDRAEVLSSDGVTRPISRGYMTAAREAGLLPVKKTG
jgi:hypothetical protein